MPAGAWTDGERAWVTLPESNGVYFYDGTVWTKQGCPVAKPRGLWGHGEQLWVAGDGGLAVLDKRGWHRVANVTGPLSEVIGHAGRLYFAGESGLWMARLAAP